MSKKRGKALYSGAQVLKIGTLIIAKAKRTIRAFVGKPARLGETADSPSAPNHSGAAVAVLLKEGQGGAANSPRSPLESEFSPQPTVLKKGCDPDVKRKVEEEGWIYVKNDPE